MTVQVPILQAASRAGTQLDELRGHCQKLQNEPGLPSAASVIRPAFHRTRSRGKTEMTCQTVASKPRGPALTSEMWTGYRGPVS